MRKLKWKKVWENTEIRQFFWCVTGVVLFKALDLTGQTFSFASLSLGYVTFAIGIAAVITLATDNDPLPANATPEQKKTILRRVAKNAMLMGFFWQTVLGKIEDLIEV